jgi:hypothetical protein
VIAPSPSLRPSSGKWWIGLALIAIGLFGTAFAVAGLLAALPLPAAGGTCGPGQGSEAAVLAMVNPHSIGAGAEPPATDRAARVQWSAFVHDCQAAADHRAYVVLPILVASLVVVVFAAVLLRRRGRRVDRTRPALTTGGWSPSPPLDSSPVTGPVTDPTPGFPQDAIPTTAVRIPPDGGASPPGGLSDRPAPPTPPPVPPDGS